MKNYITELQKSVEMWSENVWWSYGGIYQWEEGFIISLVLLIPGLCIPTVYLLALSEPKIIICKR